MDIIKPQSSRPQNQTPAPNSQMEPQHNKPEYKFKPKKDRKNLWGILLVVVLLLAVAGGVWFWQQQTINNLKSEKQDSPSSSSSKEEGISLEEQLMQVDVWSTAFIGPAMTQGIEEDSFVNARAKFKHPSAFLTKTCHTSDLFYALTEEDLPICDSDGVGNAIAVGFSQSQEGLSCEGAPAGTCTTVKSKDGKSFFKHVNEVGDGEGDSAPGTFVRYHHILDETAGVQFRLTYFKPKGSTTDLSSILEKLVKETLEISVSN